MTSKMFPSRGFAAAVFMVAKGHEPIKVEKDGGVLVYYWSMDAAPALAEYNAARERVNALALKAGVGANAIAGGAR